MDITEDTIRLTANNRLNHSSLIKIFLHQAATEWGLRLRKNLSFRTRENSRAVRAYSGMEVSEFEGINARQQWANWRTIPRNLKSRLENRPSFAIDLCCGTGHSTEVLSCYLPRGSKILGLEFNPEFVRKAREKKYFHQSGESCEVSFNAQSVLDPFRDAEGNRIGDSSVDLVNSCGAVGNHFDAQATRILAREVARVLREGGLALIDSGPSGTRREELVPIFEEQGFTVCHAAKSCFLDLHTQVCFRKAARSG